MDLISLLEERSTDGPSGANLEFDEAFVSMEIAAQPGEEHQIGDAIVEASEPDYGELSSAAMAVLERSHDLRAAVFLAVAQLRLKGLEGLSAPIAYIRECLERHWDTCHPEVEDDGADAMMRANAIFALTDNDGLVAALRRAPLTDSRSFGKFSIRDISIASGEMTASADMDVIPDAGSIAAAFKDTDPEKLSALFGAASEIVSNLTSIEAIFEERCPGQGPNLETVRTLVERMKGRLAEEVGGEPAAAEADMDDGAAPPTSEAPARPAAVAAGGGAITNATDVVNTIDRLISYYETHEPSSPVPILLSRAKRLVNADFLTIVKDMAPSGMDNVNIVGGLEEPDEY